MHVLSENRLKDLIDLVKKRVVRCGGQKTVEFRVVIRAFCDVVLCGHMPLIILVQQRNIGIGCAQCGQRCDLAVQNVPEFHQILHVGTLEYDERNEIVGVLRTGKLADEGALALTAFHKAQTGEALQRAADGNTADLKLRGKLVFRGNLVARLPFAGDQILHELLIDDITDILL